jgi:hypothetical protein
MTIKKKGFGTRESWPTWRYILGIHPVAMRKHIKTLRIFTNLDEPTYLMNKILEQYC